MKDFIIIIVIVGLIIGGSVYSHHFYEKLQEQFSNELQKLVDNIEIDTDKEKTISDIEQIWLNYETILIIFQDHASIGEIEDNLYECFHHYRMNDLNKLILYKEKTVSGFEDLIKREELLLVDIL